MNSLWFVPWISKVRSQGDFSKVIDYTIQDLAIVREVGDGAGEGGAYGFLGNAYQSQGDDARVARVRVLVAGVLFEGHRVPHVAPGDCKGGGRPGGGGHGVREPRYRV